MHSIPPWYIAFNEFGYLFHTAADLFFIVFGFLVVALVSRPGWKQHLRWANPAAAASVLTGIDRLVEDLHHYFHIGKPINAYLTADLFNYSAILLSFYSTFVFWRMIRDLVRHPASPDPFVAQEPPPGVWPPPPVMKR